MIRNFFKIAFRNLWKRKMFSFINVFGLALGLAFCGLIAIYVYDEWRVDRHQPGNLYRVITSYKSKTSTDKLNTVGRALVPTIAEEMPEVQAVIPVRSSGYNVRHQNQYFYEKTLYAGEHFLEAFNYNLLSGNPQTALTEPYTIVVTENIAKKFFNNTDVVGKTLMLADTIPFKISAVVKNPPPSHFEFDILLSFSTLTATNPNAMNPWFTWDMTCYVQLKDNVNTVQAEKKISGLSMSHYPEYKDFGYDVHHELEPVRDIYLYSPLGSLNKATGNIKQLYIFGIIGIALLLLACINFINLTTAYQSERAKEVGVRKTIGASGGTLVTQFLLETFLMVLIAAGVALALIVALLPWVSSLTEKELTLSLLYQPVLVAFCILLLITTTLLSGWYPSLLLSRLRPLESIRSFKTGRFKNFSLRKVLVVFQFSISLVLIIGTLVAKQQLNYMQQQPLGFEKDQVVVVPLRKVPRADVIANYETIKNQLAAIPGITAVTSAAAMPGRFGWDGQLVVPQGYSSDNALTMEVIIADHDYVKTMGIKMKTGRGFSKEFSTDAQNAVLLNETACRLIGWSPEEAIGKYIQTSGMDSGTVVGVMADYHQHGLQSKIGPVLSFIRPYAFNYAAVRTASGSMQQTIQKLQDFWKQRFPGYPFEYFMLDDDYDKQYKSEQNLAGITTLFSLLTIVVACMGLFGLTAFITLQRTKEIGIRKVLGASVAGITTLLSKDFLKLVAISIIIASPVAWYIMNQWLQDFNYRVSIGFWVFAVAGITAIVIALLTICIHTVKAALENPVKSLRTE